MPKTVQVILLLITFSLLPAAKAYAQSCPATSNENFGQLAVPNPFPGNDDNPELNPQPQNRQWTEVNEDKGLCQYGYPAGEPPDPRAPQLFSLSGTDPTKPGAFTRTFKVSDANWPVSFLCLQSNPCQPVRAPKTGYEIGGGYNYHVLYADENFITLANFAEDMIEHDASKPETLDVPVLGGYIIHLSNIKVDANLLQLYRTLNAQGRHSLPAVKAGQVLGWALGNDICTSIRDSDDFMDPRSRNDWWGDYMDLSVPFCKGGPSVSGSTPGVFGQRTKKHPDEKEVACQRVAYGDNQFNKDPYIYTDKNGKNQLGMRDDANLNFDSSNRGIHCGSVKSRPLVVTEVAPFDIEEGEICKKTWWMAEIGFNYDNYDNFHIPFAEEIADHWAGTLDAEHLKEEEIDNLFATAYPDFSPFDSAEEIQRKVRGVATAAAELKRRQGVLKALLPREKQDELKCSFIRFVQKKIDRAYGRSLYKDFSIGGTKLTDIPCPPTIDNRQLGLDSPEYLAWQKTWGSKWAKMGLFPNEKAVGNLRLNVCGDKTYFHSFDYPEVFRLGLAANELFKIFSDKTGQRNYYVGHGDTNKLQQSLDKNIILTAPFGGIIDRQTDAGQTVNQMNAGITPFSAATQESTVQTEPTDGMSLLLSSLKNFLPKIKTTFAQTIEKYNPFKKNGPLLLTQGCLALEAGVEVVSENPFVYALVIRRTSCAPQGVLGHIYIYPPKGWEEGRRARGEPVGPHIVNMTTDELRYDSNNPDTAGFMPKVGSLEELRQYTWNLQAKDLPQGYQIADMPFSSGGTAGPSLPSGPEEGPMCKEPPACKASCELCQKAQFGPSYTNLWSEEYPHGHTLIGLKWNGSSYDADPIKFDFTIPEWDGTYEGIAKVSGCRYKQCPANDGNCNDNASYCFPGHGCGEIECARVHDRVIDIYNEVPFLASIWDQAFEADGGIERSCYTKCLNQQKTPSECQTACSISSGFMNIFKPKCDPSDPGCPYNNTGQWRKFSGCTTNEKYVFSKEGDYAPNPGADYLTYDFHTWAGGMGSDVPEQFTEGVTVSQKSPKPGEKAEVLFYRLGGMCNANTWVSQKELHPYTGATSPFYQGGMLIPTTGPCAGKTIDPNKYYRRWTCEDIPPEPACCQGIMAAYKKNLQSEMSEDDAAHDAVWTCDERDNCYPESCPPNSNRIKIGSCSKYPSYFYRKGSVLADPNYNDPPPQ